MEKKFKAPSSQDILKDLVTILIEEEELSKLEQAKMLRNVS